MILKLCLVIKVSRTQRAEYLSGEAGLSFVCEGRWGAIFWQRVHCDLGVRVSPPVAPGGLQFPGQWRGGAGDPGVQPGTEQGVVARVGGLRTLYRLAPLLITFR